MADESYNGWANRETWAVALHINNDQGWQESVLEALRSNITSRASFAEGEFYSPEATAGEIIRENVEETLEMLLDAMETAEPNLHTGNPTGARETYESVREDIGSLWRVDWTELGAAFLSDLDEP